VARRWFDRLFSLFMPVVRYRCVSAGCGWEGLLMRRHRRQTPAGGQPPSAYRPRWLEPSRMNKPSRG